MSARIESIVDAKMYVVRTSDDRDGEQMHVIAFMPHTGRALIVQSGKMADLRAGGGPFKALSVDLEREFVSRVTGTKPTGPLAPPRPRIPKRAADKKAGKKGRAAQDD